MNTAVLIAIIAIIIIAVVTYVAFYTNKKSNDTVGGIGTFFTAGTGPSIPPGTVKPGMWTVYGTDQCGWTLKQLAVFDSKGIPYNYVNCDQNAGACKGMNAFPTLVDPNGVKTVGFNGLA